MPLIDSFGAAFILPLAAPRSPDPASKSPNFSQEHGGEGRWDPGGHSGSLSQDLFVPRSAGPTVPDAQLSVWASLALPQTRVPGRESNSDRTPSSGGSDRCSQGTWGQSPSAGAEQVAASREHRPAVHCPDPGGWRAACLHRLGLGRCPAASILQFSCSSLPAPLAPAKPLPRVI